MLIVLAPWFARAARAYTGLSQVMRVPAPADALRVARALLNISQRLAAERAQVMQKSGSAAENSKSVLSETSLALVESYRRQVIEFLGDCANGDLVRRSGHSGWVRKARQAFKRLMRFSMLNPRTFYSEQREPSSIRDRRKSQCLRN